MLEQILNVLMGTASGATIAFVFYQFFTRKYKKLLDFANDLASKLEKIQQNPIPNPVPVQNSVPNPVPNPVPKEEDEKNDDDDDDDDEEEDSETDEIDEINKEIRALRKQIVATRDPRMYNFLREKIRYLENRKKALMSLYPSQKREILSVLPDLSNINLEDIDKLSDEQLMALAQPFMKYIPRQFRSFVNPATVRLFVKNVLPNIIKSDQQQQTQQQQQQPPIPQKDLERAIRL